MESRLESLDLNLLLVLHWLLEERSVTAAASRLGLSQPATSRALGRLREIFGDPLMVKSGAVMVPTPVAESMQPVVARAMTRCRDVLKAAEPFDPAEEGGRFRVACVDVMGVAVARVWGQSVAPLAPGVTLDIVTPTLDGAREMVSGQLDLSILPDLSYLDLPPTVPVDDYVQRPLLTHHYACAVRKEHPLAGREVGLDDYLAYDHVLTAPSGGLTGIVDDLLTEQGRTRRVAYRVSSFLLALAIVESTDCILTTPGPVLDIVPDAFFRFAPPLDVPDYNMGAVWHPNWTTNRRHRFLRERLFEGFAALKVSAPPDAECC